MGIGDVCSEYAHKLPQASERYPMGIGDAPPSLGSWVATHLVGEIPNGNWRLANFRPRLGGGFECRRDTQWELATRNVFLLKLIYKVGEIPNGNWRLSRPGEPGEESFPTSERYPMGIGDSFLMYVTSASGMLSERYPMGMETGVPGSSPGRAIVGEIPNGNGNFVDNFVLL